MEENLSFIGASYDDDVFLPFSDERKVVLELSYKLLIPLPPSQTISRDLHSKNIAESDLLFLLPFCCEYFWDDMFHLYLLFDLFSKFNLSTFEIKSEGQNYIPVH